MDFDKGWGRIENILLILGGLFALFMRDSDDIVRYYAVVPFLTAKLIKWIIDGFRSKEADD